MTISKIRVGGTDHDLRAKYLETTPSSEAKSVEFYTRNTTENATVATIQKIYGNKAVENGNLVALTASSITAKDANDNVIGSSALNITSLTGKLNGAGSSITIYPLGMGYINATYYDELTGKTTIRRVRVVDMGDLTWSTQSENRFFTRPTDSPVKNDFALACVAYTPCTASNAYANPRPNMVIWAETMSNQSCIRCRNTSYSDAATFKTAMAGTLLIYQLATAEEYILDTPIQTEYPVATGGTESIVPSDPSQSAPIKMDVIYGNAADTISNLPTNYISVDSMKDFLSALGTQMNGTWTMEYVGGKYTFTFTSN